MREFVIPALPQGDGAGQRQEDPQRLKDSFPMNAALKQEGDDVSKKVEDKCSPQGYPLTTASNSVACIYLRLFPSQKE